MTTISDAFSKMLVRSLLLILILLLANCSEKTEFTPIYDVPDEFQSFIEAFEHEAALRGHDISITNLIVKYDNTIPDPYCGACNSNSLDNNIQKIISINPELNCWNSPEEEEALLFHELGHCILGREHDASLLPNGDPKSIMIPNDLLLYAPCVYDIDPGAPCNERFKRSYYIDELFDVNTPVPDWGN